jgi:CheY-like chemotaxis protein/two-component sensor histidine kinase
MAKDLRIFTRERPSATQASADVNHVIESSIRLAWTEIRHKAQLERRLSEVPRARGSENRLGQVVLNLVLNAAQAIPAGRADHNRIAVTSALDASGENVIITVADTGSGIPEVDLPKIFTPLFTTKAVGTGLGLAICERIVRDLGGRIEVESRQGEGSLFRVLLPVADPPPSSARGADAPAATLVAERRRVAIIDDEPPLLRALTRILDKRHSVRSFQSAEAALKAIDEGDRFDVILCDVMMPVVTGIEFFHRLAKDKPELAERVVFLSGGSANPTVRAALGALPNRRLEKPCDTDKLLEVIAATPKLDPA